MDMTPNLAAGRNPPLPICVIGDVNIDLVMGPLAHWPAVGTETILPRSEMRPGGSAGNAALALRRIGADVTLVSSAGNDTLGDWLRGQLCAMARIATATATTSITVAVLDPASERTFLTTQGHLAETDWAQLAPAIEAPAGGKGIALLTGAFLMPGLRSQYGDILSHVRRLGYAIALDTGWPAEGWTAEVITEVRAWLPHVDHLLLNEAEVFSLSGLDQLDAALSRLHGWARPGASIVAKLGARGALGLGNTEQAHYTPAARHDIFDTVGAGDAFNAGYLHARGLGADLAAALKAGCDLATETISHFPRQAGLSDAQLPADQHMVGRQGQWQFGA